MSVPDAGDIAALVFTAGTGGTPAGVLLDHGNLSRAVDGLCQALELGSADRLLSYLPLAHLAEQLWTIHIPIRVGALVHYASSLASAADDLRHVKPTVFLGVPQVWREMRASVERNLARTQGFQRGVIGWSRRTAARVHEGRRRGSAVGLGTRLAHGAARYLVLSRLERALGLGDTRVRLNTGGPLDDATRGFFASLDLPISDWYGQVETSYATALVTAGGVDTEGSAGLLSGASLRVVAPRQVALGESLEARGVGELAVSGPVLAAGNLDDGRDADDSRFTDPDGITWLRSGDLGSLDEGGYPRVLGRVDRCLVANGRAVMAEPLEAALREHELVRDAVVFSGPGGSLAVLIFVAADARDRYAAEPGVERSDEAWARDPGVLDALRSIIAQLNEGRDERPPIAHLAVSDHEPTVERGELTPTLGLRVVPLQARYAGRLVALVGGRSGRG